MQAIWANNLEKKRDKKNFFKKENENPTEWQIIMQLSWVSKELFGMAMAYKKKKSWFFLFFSTLVREAQDKKMEWKITSVLPSLPARSLVSSHKNKIQIGSLFHCYCLKQNGRVNESTLSNRTLNYFSQIGQCWSDNELVYDLVQ